MEADMKVLARVCVWQWEKRWDTYKIFWISSHITIHRLETRVQLIPMHTHSYQIPIKVDLGTRALEIKEEHLHLHLQVVSLALIKAYTALSKTKKKSSPWALQTHTLCNCAQWPKQSPLYTAALLWKLFIFPTTFLAQNFKAQKQEERWLSPGESVPLGRRGADAGTPSNS